MSARSESTRSRRKWPWFLGGALLLIVVVVATSGGGGDEGTATASGSPTGVTVRYEVVGDGVATASVTYVADENFSQQQANGAALPWSADVAFPDAGVLGVQPLVLTAQSQSQTGGEITCTILRDGVVVTSSTSSGPFAVVTCSGS